MVLTPDNRFLALNEGPSLIWAQRELSIDNLVRIHFIIVMIRWTGLAPWEFEFPFPRKPYIYLPMAGKHNSTCLSRGYYETMKRFMDRVVAESAGEQVM